MKAEDIWLTTKDNEWNPFLNYDEWRDYDTDAYAADHPAYCTEAYLMRVLGMRNPLDYSTDAIVEELMNIFEEIITINNEIGNDVYCIITREGTKLDHVPPELLYNTPKAYVPKDKEDTPGEGSKTTPTP